MISQWGFASRAAIAITASLTMACAFSAYAQQDTSRPDSYRLNDREPDPRFKADILVVIAHPDDEVMATAYLAREIFDEHKHVAIAYGTRGDGGNNAVGPEQAAGMGDIREIEARRAVGTLGITNVWFLGGRDTTNQNVLASLEHWGHGAALDELIRVVRITRPTVILTFLPDFTTGENHADHQAAGVLATEAFDLAGDPTGFPEQVSPVIKPDGNMNLTEALRPWQPQKIYYFYNPTHDIFQGQGPQYAGKDISPSKHESYGMLAAKAFEEHKTQGGLAVQQAIDNKTLDTSKGIARIITGPTQLIFGKSLVPSGPMDDVFAGVKPEGIRFVRAPGYTYEEATAPTLEMGDPWSFYRKFWKAHGIDHLSNVVPYEISVHTATSLYIPLIVDNPLDTPLKVAFSVKAPDGWTVTPVAPATVDPHDQYFVRVEVKAPETKLPGWQEFTISGNAGDKSIGTVSLRAELSTGWVASQ